MSFSYFNKVTDNKPAGTVTLCDLYTLVAFNDNIREATEMIRAKHRAGILDSWQTLPKAEYQADKARLLPVIMSGTGSGRKNEIPSGYIFFDIDEGSKQGLKQLQETIKQGKVPFVAFCAESVAGDGSFFIIASVEIPATEDAPRWLVDRIGKKEYLAGIYELYHDAIRAAIAKDGAGALAGKAGKSPENTRYLAYDSCAYYPDKCEQYSLKRLKEALRGLDSDRAQFTTRADQANITTADNWQGFCEQYAGAQYQPVQGQLHNYLNEFSIAANLLGISSGEVYKYAEVKGYKVTTNCIEYPYTNYAGSFGIWANRIEAAPVQTYTLLPGQRLSDVLKIDNILGKLLQAPTGTGKSYLICKSGVKAVVLCPTRALVDNFADQYGAIPYYQGKKYSTEQLHGAPLIAVTYDSFRQLSGYLTPVQGLFHVFCDEAHTFVSNASFRAEALHSALEYLQEPAPGQTWASVTMLSATPLPAIHPFLSAFELVKVQAPGRVAGTVHKVNAAPGALIASTAELIVKAAKEGRRALVLLNDKAAKRDQLKLLLGYADTVVNYATISADSEDQEREFLEQLTGGGGWPEDTQCIITTTVLKEGNSLSSSAKVDVIIAGGGFNSSDIAQFSARVRGQAPDIYIVRGESKERTAPGNLCAAEFYRQAIERANNAINTLSTPNTAAPAGWRYTEIAALRKINGLCVLINDTGYQIDYIALQAAYFKALTAAESSSDRLFTANLAKYGIQTAPDPVQVEKSFTRSEIAFAKAEAKAEQSTNEACYFATIKELLTILQTEGEARTDQHIQQNLINSREPIVKLIAGRYTTLVSFTKYPAGALNWLAETGYKQSSYALEAKRALHYTALHDSEYRQQQGRNYKRIAIALTAELLSNETPYYTSDKLAAIWDKYTAGRHDLTFKYDSSEGAKKRYTAVLNKLRQFFALDKISVRNEAGKVVKAYKVSKLGIAKYFTRPEAPAPAPDPERPGVLTEAERIAQLLAGQTVIVNMKQDKQLLTVAQSAGLFTRCDRYTMFGNPYRIGKDGNRHEVCDKYESYLTSDAPGAQKIRASIHNLRGRALGCHCYPERCHCEALKRLAYQ